jgi:hypothetical protein
MKHGDLILVSKSNLSHILDLGKVVDDHAVLWVFWEETMGDGPSEENAYAGSHDYANDYPGVVHVGYLSLKMVIDSEKKLLR